ncbi:MAG TPA: hypothetical protein VFA45_11190 [Actinomycetes bacterium]|nr:hypothetical protein [Actinomycetes bacterium]
MTTRPQPGTPRTPAGNVAVAVVPRFCGQCGRLVRRGYLLFHKAGRWVCSGCFQGCGR